MTADYLDGTHSLRLRSSAEQGLIAHRDLDPAVTVGETVTCVGSFKAATSVRACSMGIRFTDGAGSTVGPDIYGADVKDAAGSVGAYWVQCTVTATVPAGATNATPLARVKFTGAADEDHFLDNVSFHQNYPMSLYGWKAEAENGNFWLFRWLDKLKAWSTERGNDRPPSPLRVRLPDGLGHARGDGLQGFRQCCSDLSSRMRIPESRRQYDWKLLQQQQ